jgi:hypothetical protein
MKTYGGEGVQIHVFVTLATVAVEWSASLSGRFSPGERALDIHLIGGWVDPELVWTTWKGEKSSPYRESNSDPSAVEPVASRYTDYAIPATHQLI